MEAGIFDYKDEKIVAVVSAFGTILSSLFPVGSIFALYFIRDTLQRLAAIACFMTLFSAILAILTDARRVDIFAATAA